MLTLTIFLPLLTGLLVLLLPGDRPRLVRGAGLAGALLTLLLCLLLWAGFDPGGAEVQLGARLEWIPSLGAAYDVGLTGISLPLVVLTALLLALSLLYALPDGEGAKGHTLLFLLMGTGLLGLFAARDLLLFYLFFEVALVPMYFVIGVWGGARRRYAALKFFLYTRAGSLAMLLSFLALYLSAEPRSFALADLAAAQPLAGSPAGFWVLLGLLLGFGVKLPTVPFHNWLPDAHVEAPTEGSVMLAGVQLKMGAYGFVAILLPLLPEATARYAWLLGLLGLLSLVYGALAALAQKDLKRLIAYTSVSHMGYVLLGVAVWGMSDDPGVRRLALNGAVLQMVSHGLLTGGMFFLAGLLQKKAGTREMDRLGGLLRQAPRFSALLALLAFGSLGLPGLSGFVAEFQVLGALLAASPWLAVGALLGLAITTGLYLNALNLLVLRPAPADAAPVTDVGRSALLVLVPLALLALLLGLLPGTVLRVVESATRLLGG